jgi:Mrp family chromosome partitioning ATPase
LLVALLVGFAIPSLIIWARTQLNTKVRARKEVEDNLSAPILGSIPRWDEDGNEEKLLSKKSAASSVAEAFRILRYNIDMVAKRPAVIMTTSSTPSQGKSFTSRNLAVIFGIAGKKVLLVDADIRKG